MKKRRGKPETYVCTIDPMSPADMDMVKFYRDAARYVNRHLRVKGKRYRVSISPRAPKPQFRWKYENRHHKRVRLEDAATADVYVKLVPRHRSRSKSRRAAAR